MGYIKMVVSGKLTFSYANPITGIKTGYTSNVSFDGILYKNNIEMGWSNSGNVKNPGMRAYDYSNIFQMVYDNKYKK